MNSAFAEATPASPNTIDFTFSLLNRVSEVLFDWFDEELLLFVEFLLFEELLEELLLFELVVFEDCFVESFSLSFSTILPPSFTIV